MQKEYASEIVNGLTKLGLWADVDNGENTLPKKIRNGEIAQYNFIFGRSLMHSPSPDNPDELLLPVVGQDELETRSVNVRNRDDVGTKARSEVVPLDTVEKQLLALKESRSLSNRLV